MISFHQGITGVSFITSLLNDSPQSNLNLRHFSRAHKIYLHRCCVLVRILHHSNSEPVVVQVADNSFDKISDSLEILLGLVVGLLEVHRAINHEEDVFSEAC